jgi:hypothetical protein
MTFATVIRDSTTPMTPSTLNPYRPARCREAGLPTPGFHALEDDP